MMNMKRNNFQINKKFEHFMISFYLCVHFTQMLWATTCINFMCATSNQLICICLNENSIIYCFG